MKSVRMYADEMNGARIRAEPGIVPDLHDIRMRGDRRRYKYSPMNALFQNGLIFETL